MIALVCFTLVCSSCAKTQTHESKPKETYVAYDGDIDWLEQSKIVPQIDSAFLMTEDDNYTIMYLESTVVVNNAGYDVVMTEVAQPSEDMLIYVNGIPRIKITE